MDYLWLMGKLQLPYAHLPATLVVRLLQAGKDRGVGRVWLPAYSTNSSWSQPEIWVLWLGIISIWYSMVWPCSQPNTLLPPKLSTPPKMHMSIFFLFDHEIMSHLDSFGPKNLSNTGSIAALGNSSGSYNFLIWTPLN